MNATTLVLLVLAPVGAVFLAGWIARHWKEVPSPRSSDVKAPVQVFSAAETGRTVVTRNKKKKSSPQEAEQWANSAF